MYTLGALGVVYDPARPAWRDYRIGQTIDPYDIPDEIIDKWRETRPGQAGYNATQSCYCWGYRPSFRPLTLDGVHWAQQQTPWRICNASCPTPTCPAPPAPPPCPPQQACPTPEPCPIMEPTTCERAPEPIERNKNWLWAVGFGVLVVGVYGVRRTMAMRR